ncbi:hypothetical protein ACOMHN_035131 [Nucella lapillus]
MDTGYDDWEPPSEATVKLREARRERSNKISKVMGDYLLKGYKMLGICCPQCETILLQTKQGVNYCISCSELDSDADKDDPVTSQTAALAQARELEVRETSSRSAVPSTPAPPPPPPPQTQQSAAPLGRPCNTQSNKHHAEVSTTYETSNPAGLSRVPPPWLTQGANMTANASSGDRAMFRESEKYVKDLLDKMDWATSELRATASVEYSIQLCQLIKSCAEAVTSVRAALNTGN